MGQLTQKQCYDKYWCCDDHTCPFYDMCDSGELTNMTLQDIQLKAMEGK